MPGLKTVIAIVAATSVVVSLSVALYWSSKTDEVDTSTSSHPVPQTQGPAAYKLTPEELREEFEHERNTRLALTELHEELELERNARFALSDDLNELRNQFSEFLTDSGHKQTEAMQQAASEFTKKDDLESEFAELWFDEQALYNEGLSVSEVDRLRHRFDEVELEKLSARDRAARDGWSSSSLHSQELRDIQTRFRQELGDQDYDKILYAAGRSNRVQVDDLLGGSAAANSGIMIGDEIYSYAGERVFDPSSLYILTTKGEVGESVEIVILRNGSPYVINTLRGPLGTNLRHIRRPPGG